MEETEEELEKLKIKYESLQREWESQQEHLGKLQGEIFKLRDQLEQETLFCASLGSNLANLLWKSSRFESVVDTLLNAETKQDFKPGKLSEFFSIVIGTMESFMEAYFDKFPDQESQEMQFVLSLVGVIANIAASHLGRQFLSTDENGVELINMFLDMLPKLPQGTGDPLKRMLMMLMYNFSINQNGMLMLQQSEIIIAEIQKGIKSHKSPELKLLSLRLLQSISCEITSIGILHEIMDAIPLYMIRELEETHDAEMWTIAQDITNNLEKAIAHFNDKPPNQGSVPYETCYMVNNFNQPQYRDCGCLRS